MTLNIDKTWLSSMHDLKSKKEKLPSQVLYEEEVCQALRMHVFW